MTDGEVLGQILAEQRRVATDVAVIKERLQPIADHEQRLRSLEKWKYGLPIASLLAVGSSVLAAYGWLHH